MAILYYSAEDRLALATDPLLLAREPEEEVRVDPVEVDELSTYFLRVFDPEAPMARRLDRLPFVKQDGVYPHGLCALSFRNRAGLTRIGPIQLRVTSSKLSEQRYHALLDYLTDRFANLVFSFHTQVGENVRKDRPGQDLPYIEFLFLDRFLLGSPPRIGILSSLLLSDPHRLLERVSRYQPPALVAHTSPGLVEEMLLAPHRLSGLAAHSAAAATNLARRLQERTGRSLFPAEIRAEEKRFTLDTRENRFVKFFLERLLRRVRTLRHALAAESDGYLNPEMGEKLRMLERGLGTLLAAPLWKDVGKMTEVPAGSQVLQKKDAYRQLFRLYCLLYLLTVCNFDALNFRNILETKDIPLLYETWCFFVLKDILDGMARPLSTQPIVVADAREQKVVVGYRVEYPDGIELRYNRTYGAPSESYSHAMRPDLVLHRNDRAMVFDAQFKVADGGAFNWDDIDKMHTYREALKGIAGAFILYPGTSTAAALFRAYAGASEYEGVGAFPLVPGEGGRPLEPQTRAIAKTLAAFLADGSDRSLA